MAAILASSDASVLPNSCEVRGAENDQSVRSSPPATHANVTHLSDIPVLGQPDYLGITVPHAGELEYDAIHHDIYRGGRLSPVLRMPDLDEQSLVSSSSSSSLNVGRRLGALATVVEAAITRWARTHSSASSSSSSSSSSVFTTARTHVSRRRKGRRYSSTASMHNAAHERAILARKKAREEFRVVAREFTLLLPSELVPGMMRSPQILERDFYSAEAREQANERRVIRTASMALVLAQLGSALKKSAKWRRTQERTVKSVDPSTITSYKGKSKRIMSVGDSSSTTRALSAPASSKTSDASLIEKGWWLDVASPTWDDLRSIGKILHLHPLTLEDILHQDPREKLELFPGLGYYFVVFRALESEQSRERFRSFKAQDSGGTSLPSGSGDEGVTGAVNVYLVVFREGICSFHFEDISEHTEKLRNKVLHMEDTFHMTSDWIAHGLLDSIVDSFFPILAAIEKEVKEVDALVLENFAGSDTNRPVKVDMETFEQAVGGSSTDASFEKEMTMMLSSLSAGEKGGAIGKEGYTHPSPQFFIPQTVKVSDSCFRLLHHIAFATQNFFWNRKMTKELRRVTEKQSVSFTSKTLLRMAATRRIVTSLGRLLGTKGEVIAQIRKRLLTTPVEASNGSFGLGVLDGGEIAIYMGDIQDHIMTLQQSLAHYERVLSHSHPAYLSQLRVAQSVARGGTDTAILLLSVISMIVLCCQVLLGLFSVNVGKVPHNRKPGGPYTLFYIILGVSVLIGFGLVALVRFWHVRAKKRFSRKI